MRRVQAAPSATLAVWVALGLGLLAAFFAAGILATDDHFFVVDVAGQWMHGTPALIHDARPPSRSLLWPALIYGALEVARRFGLNDPAKQMILVRAFQALAGALIVRLLGRHGLGLGRPRGAVLAEWLTAAMYFMPFFFVRQLFEVGCLPFLVGALYLLDPDVPRDAESRRMHASPAAFLGGILLGLAAVIRPQILLFAVGGGLVLLWKRRWGVIALAILGFAVVAGAEGYLDFRVWGRWFAPQFAYLDRNLLGYSIIGQDYYVSGPWWKHIAFLSALLIPPLSLLLFYGAVRGARSAPFVAAGVLCFLVGHSMFPGKQERFIIPMLPHFFLLAGLGLAREGVGARLRGWRWVWAVGLAVNLILLPFWITNYTQRARIESVRAAVARPDARGFIVIQTAHAAADVPAFYLYPYRPYVSIEHPEQLTGGEVKALKPNYAVMYGDENQIRWLQALKDAGFNPAPIQVFPPSPVDDFFHRINPYRNHSRSATLYRL